MLFNWSASTRPSVKPPRSTISISRSEPGEFFSLLGPSGCGKTSTLRLIAGFERPTERADPDRRQGHGGHASPPPPGQHGLPELRPVPSSDASGTTSPSDSSTTTSQNRRPASGSAGPWNWSGWAALKKRKPTQLSGGQQQRVALARSLVLNPSVLLLDEPLGALDAKLRKALQIELKALQEDVGITFIYVTHDQEEALTMSDRLAVMSAGRIEQLGTPSDVYEQPASAYVADFLGLSNLMAADAVGPSASGGCRVMIGSHELVAGAGAVDSTGPVRVCIRPERVVLGSYVLQGSRGNDLPGVVDRVVYMGPMLQVLIEVDGIGSIQAVVPNQGSSQPPTEATRFSSACRRRRCGYLVPSAN